MGFNSVDRTNQEIALKKDQDKESIKQILDTPKQVAEISKTLILSSVEKYLDDQILIAKNAENWARQTANEAEGAMQTRYGSTKEEFQALTAGYTQKVLELQSHKNILKQNLETWEKTFEGIGISSLVEVEILNKKIYVLLLPFGGFNLSINWILISIISQKAPFYQAVYGKKINDIVRLPTGEGKIKSIV